MLKSVLQYLVNPQALSAVYQVNAVIFYANTSISSASWDRMQMDIP
jgi:hypothetical protein